jgi:DUF1680 family protein
MALVELSRLTGEGRYRELATTLIARRGHGFLGPGRFGGSYYQDDTPYVGMDTLSGHAVRATYLAAGAVDVAVDNQDEALVEASHRQWRNVLRARTYITGGIGARHLGESFGDDYELPADAAYAETCAAIGLIMWSWRLQLTRLDSAFGDLIERAVYNAILPAVAPDGRSYHYTNPLEVHSSHPRREWFEIACCPPNAMRTISILNQFVATENDTGVQLHQYASGRVLTAFGRLQVTTSYPSGGGIAVTVFPCTGGRWELMLRVPVWSRANWSLRLNGEPFQAPLAHGFARLARAWDEADLVELTLDMAPRFTTADPRVGMGCSVVLERGPIVYCLDEAQSGVGHPGLITLPHGPPPATVEVDPESPPNLRVLVEAGSPRSGWPYSSTPSMTRPAAQMGTFVPFAMAGTRGPGAIRAWVGRQATPT